VLLVIAPRELGSAASSALRRAKHLDVIDDRGACSKPGGNLAGQTALVLARHRTPKQHLATAHYHADLTCVDFPIVPHLFLDAAPQLGIARRDLAHIRVMIGWVHTRNVASHMPSRSLRHASSRTAMRGEMTLRERAGSADRARLGARAWHVHCSEACMDRMISRLLTLSTLGIAAGVLSIASCTHTSDRVVEPVGGGDASTTSPELGDGGVNPIGPIALPLEPREDFRLVRAPEFGVASALRPVTLDQARTPGAGGSNAAGSGGVGGSDQRPANCGGNYY